MSDQYVAEIRLFAGNFAPTGWAQCNGQLIPISQNTALFSLLGTTYGGNGTTTFALPNLQGAAPMFYGQGPGLSPHQWGEAGGSSSVELLPTELPAHAHTAPAFVGRGANSNTPASSRVLAASQGGEAYAPPGQAAAMAPDAVATAGGGQSHNNMMPSLGLTFIIALQGIYPPRS